MARKRFTDEQVVEILKAAAAGMKTEEVCRKQGVSPNTFYVWRQKFAGMTVPDIKRLKALEDENLRLQKKVAQLPLDIDMVKELLTKNF